MSNKLIKPFSMVVKENARLKGTINTPHSVKIGGFFEGKISSGKNVLIEATAIIDGDIEAESVIISGDVKGNVIASTKIHLTATSKLEGKITTENFIIDKGAYFLGNCKRTRTRTA